MMKTMNTMLVVSVLGLCLATSGAARAEGETELTAELRFCKALEKYKPVDPGSSFERGKVYAWTLIQGGKGSFEVQHLWYKNGKQVYKHTVKVRGGKYPTWSFLIASPGAYKVEVADSEGKVFQTGEFTVK